MPRITFITSKEVFKKMKRSILMLLLAIFLIFLNLQPHLAQADNDKDKHKYREHDEEWEHDDDDDDDDEDEYEHDDDDTDDDDEEYYQPIVQLPVTSVIQQSAFIWDRNKLPVGDTIGNTFIRQPIAMNMKGNSSTIQIIGLNNEGMIMVPLKNIAQYLDSEVYWHPKYQVIEVKTNEKQLLFKVGKAVCYENGIKLPMATAPMLIDGTVYVPVNVLTDGLGYQANLNSTTPNEISLTRR